MASRIIILNGVGSVGKTSIAKALQSLAETTFLHVEMDAFLNMLPEKTFGRPEGLCFDTVLVDGKPEVVITSGPAAERCLDGMRHAVKTMADRGNNLIVDDVLMDGAGAEYGRLLSQHDLKIVGIFAPLAVVETRERERGDRMIGLARWQFDRVHLGLAYDLEVDATDASPMACAQRIKKRFGL
jgi:chloramphenicol 3-O phosphotransferase